MTTTRAPRNPYRRGRSRKASETTQGWSSQFREQILRDLDQSGGNVLAVALANRINVTQIQNCIARARYVAAFRYVTADRLEFLKRVDEKARAGLIYALENMDDPAKLGQLCCKVLEGTRTFQTEKASSVNVFGPAQFNLADLTNEQLAERAEQLAARLRDLQPGSRQITAGTGGDPSGEPA